MEKKTFTLWIIGFSVILFLWSPSLIGGFGNGGDGCEQKNFLLTDHDFGGKELFESKNAMDINEVLPESWDWRNAEYGGMKGDWTTPAKNQRNRCYVFTIIGALESIVKIKEQCVDFSPDLSEQFLISYDTYDNLLENRCGHTTFEAWCPYRGISGIIWKHLFNPSLTPPSEWQEYLVPISNFSVQVRTLPPSDVETVRSELKTLVLNHGPIGIRIYAPGMSVVTVGSLRNWGLLHTSPSDYYSGDAPQGIFNQAVVLVGWKDDSLVENGGYWIIKNSWGPFWGNQGFFNLEYGSLNSDCGYYILVDYDQDSFNWPPLGNPVLVAPEHMEEGQEYLCSFSSIDPEQNQKNYTGKIYYNFSWDDETYSGWLGPYESGEKCMAPHIWNTTGEYRVKVKVKDDPNGDGDLSDGKETLWLPSEPSRILDTLSEQRYFLSAFH